MFECIFSIMYPVLGESGVVPPRVASTGDYVLYSYKYDEALTMPSLHAGQRKASPTGR
jgi:hypothetical protein